MVFNAIFKNISVISWRSVLLVKETRVSRENHRFWTSIILVEYIEWDICIKTFYLVIYNLKVYLQTPSVRITSVVPSPILLRKSEITGKFFCFKIPFTHVVCSYNEIHSFLIKHITISLIHKFTIYRVIINPCNTPINLVCKNHLWIL